MASPTSRTALFAVIALWFPWQGAAASDRIESRASVTVVQSAAVTVVSNAPLQTILLTVAIAPVGVVFTASGVGSVAASAPVGGAAGGGATGGGSPVSPPPGGGAADGGAAGAPLADGSAPGGLIAVGGSLTGTTIAGDAVSVSVGDVSGGTAEGSARVPVVIAQYN